MEGEAVKMATENSYTGIDIFRIIAAVLVVAIHTSPLKGFSDVYDFILTRIIARTAVPFFFVTSGFFLFSREENGSLQFSKVLVFARKMAMLYGVTSLLYLPVNCYSGKVKEWAYFPNLLKDITFDGTFYHLWYLPASILGAFITWLMLKNLGMKQAFAVCLLLYVTGLFGDSYYGLVAGSRFLKSVYDVLFMLFDYTRNGLFYAPVFFLLGALLSQNKKILKLKTCATGFAVSVMFMVSEGLLLHSLNMQKHDSMYFTLLPCMYFLFQILLRWRGKRLKYLRDVSLYIYLLHPAVIIAVRGFAKAAGLEELLVRNNIVHFASVTVVSTVIAVLISMVLNPGHKPKNDIYNGAADRAWVEINMENLRHNVRMFQKILPEKCKIMAVVKGNAYGHGLVPVSLFLNRLGIEFFAVATIDEGILLRKSGIKGEILVLGFTPAERAGELYLYSLSQTVVDVEHAKDLNTFGKPIQVHIKVNTGMNRLGEDYEHVSEIASIFNLHNLKVKGIFTHLCASDSLEETDIAFTKEQAENFYGLLKKLYERGIKIPPVHIQSTYGVLNYPEIQCDYTRIGIGLYGVLSTLGKNTRLQLDLKPVLSLKSRVVLIRTVEAGGSIGYGHDYTISNKAKIAIVPVGYADGFSRSLSGKGYVLVKGHRAPVVGKICMDQFMVDVSEIPDVKRGDIVTLIGKDGTEEISAELVASTAGTITNELLSRLNDCRLKRIYINSEHHY